MNKYILICGKSEVMLPYFPEEIIDGVITSPPYDDMDENFNPIQKSGLRSYDGYSWDFKAIAKGLYDTIKEGGVVVWVVNDPTIDGSESLASSYQKIYFRKIGFNIHDTMIYYSEKPTLNHNRYEPEFEYMFVLSKGKPKTFNPILIKTKYAGEIKKMDYGIETTAKKEVGDSLRRRKEICVVKDTKIKGDVWKYPGGYNHTATDYIAFNHPAIFPEDLARDHIKSWSNPNDWILDPFVGSGTTMKEALKLGRNCVGIETSKKYCDDIKTRLNWSSSLGDNEFIYLTEQEIKDDPTTLTQHFKQK